MKGNHGCDFWTADDQVGVEHRIGGGYLYRPRELLVHEADLAQVMKALAHLDVATRCAGPGYGSTRLVTVAPSERRTVPQLVETLRDLARSDHDRFEDDAECRERPLRVSPNHVLTGYGHSLPFPGGPPSPAERGLPPRDTDSCVGEGVTVAILDSGIVARHPWFGTPMPAPEAGGFESEPAGTTELPTYAGHGTFIAGVVLQRAPAAHLRILKAFDGRGYIDDVETAGMIAGLEDVDVVNLSFGAFTHDNDGLPGVDEAVRGLLQRERRPVVVAAAGNEGDSRPSWPAAVKGVLAVAATDGEGARAEFSNYGSWVDAAAPGVGVVSTFFDGWLTPGPFKGHASKPGQFNGFAHWSGTSFAAPFVAGEIAGEMTTAGVGAPEAAFRLLQRGRLDPDLGAVLTP